MKPINNVLGEAKLKVILQAERSAALGTSMSSDLSDQRIRAMDYYLGDMSTDMPAEDGQSSAVSTNVQDVVEGLLPIILDILTSGENVVEFTPLGPGDEDAAAQETDVVNHVFYQENDGFLILSTLVKDALLSKNCFVKWFMEEEEERTREHYKGLTEDAFAILTADKGVKVVKSETWEDVDPITQQPLKLFNAVAETTENVKRRCVAAMPPEEVLFSKNTRIVRTSPYWCHVSRKPQADVILQFPEKEAAIRAAPAAVVASSDNSEANARQTVQDNQDSTQSTDDINTDMRLIEVAEHYIRLALEEDKVPRKYKITTTGTSYEILDIEEVASWPAATGTPIIMPHRLFGRAVADLVVDIQQINTALLRATLNNAYFANNQRTEVSETHASENTIDDLLNNRVGGIVRTKMPGGLNQLETQPIGHWILPVMEHMKEVQENRTGVSRYNQGLDGDSLNHTATGITRIMDAAEMRIKLIARTLAETLLVDMFRGIHEMVQENGEAQENMQLRGKWVTVDPREWKKRRHMKVTLPLGGASKQQLLQFFAQVMGIQKEVIAVQGGVDGPLISLKNIYNTAEQMTKLAGLKSVQPFFMEPPPPNPNAPKPPDPKMVEAQSKAQIGQQKMQADAQAGQQKLVMMHEMEQMKAALQHQRDADEFAHKQQLEQMQFQHDTQMEQLHAGLEMRLKAFEIQEEAKLNQQQAALQSKQGVGNV